MRIAPRALIGVVLIALLLALPVAAAVPLTPPAESPPASSTLPQLDVKEITLDNGLRIFVIERSASPTFAALYQFGVGGTSDPKGRSGIAHLLEHMMFKGTANIGILDPEKEQGLMRRLSELWHELHLELDRRDDPFQTSDEEKIRRLEQEIEQVSAEQKKLVVKNEYDELMTRAGSVSMNASTNNDVTRYYIQLPANRLEFWFQMESDRLLNPVFREFYSERDVVYEERRLRTENTAAGRSSEALQTLMFTAHPYGVPVVGWPRDLQRLIREDAEDYFTTYYSPSNCIMAIAGDVSAAEIERLAKKYFGPWKRQQLPRLPVTREPSQQGERRRVVEFDAEPDLRMAWLTVPEGHPDQPALDVLSLILGGLWSSRFDETIVQKERLASRAGTGHPTMKYAGYFSASGSPRGEHTTAELEAAIEREIKRVQTDGVTAEELERAKVAYESGRVQNLKSNLGQAFRVANAVFFSGGVDYLAEQEARLNAVTAEQVRDVAVRYLTPRRKNVVEVRKVADIKPEGDSGSGVSHQRGGTPGKRGAAHSKGFGKAMQVIESAKPVQLRVPEIGKDVRRVELDSGITVFVKEDHSAPSVEMGFAWLGGSNTTAVEELAPFRLASSLLDEGGTASLSPAELQARKDELGMSFGIWVGSTTAGASFWSLKRNFSDSFDLALEVLTKPRFDEGRLETLKGQYIQRMRRRADSPGRGVATLLDHVINKEHPRLGYVPSKSEIEAITPDKVREIWRRYLGRDNLHVTVVGDFDADEMLEHIERKLGSWREARDKTRKYIVHDPFVHPGAFVVEKEIPQPAVRIYHQIPVDRSAPLEDHAALEILNDILGGSGFRSRLMERLRSDEGLTYGVYSSLSHQSRPGVPGRFQVSYQTKKESVAHSIDVVVEELARVIEEQVGPAEVQEQIEAWRNRFVFQYTNDFYTVSRLMYNEIDDRPYDFDRIELDAVQKVTVEDVQRVARKYLAPENLTVAVFGALTEEDKKTLGARFGLTVLDRQQVFAGGYDDPPVEQKEAALVP